MQKLKLTYTNNQTVARILLDDGKGNVLDSIMMRGLLDLLKDFQSQKDLKLIIFEGAGKNFSFGASVQEHTKEQAENMLNTFHEIFFRLINLSIPTLAKVHGHCLGGGFELALMCNFLFLEKEATLGQPEITLGVFAPPASVMLPLKIGGAKAEELLITGRNIKAVEASKIGLVTEIFPDKETLDKGVDQWIEKFILPKSASSLRYAVRAARNIFNQALQTKLPKLEDLYVNQLMSTRDANEGINSFLEKRKPVWENC